MTKKFVGVVESGKDERCTRFQQRLHQLKSSRSRSWKYLLILYTSRLVRGRYFAQVFKRDCKRVDIKLLEKKYTAAQHYRNSYQERTDWFRGRY